MLPGDKYSLMIPTFNRPGLLNALLGYLASKGAQFPIYVLDSSEGANKEKNAAVIAKYATNSGLRIQHLQFEVTARFDFKIGAALDQIGSDYVSLCADDDIVFVEAIDACVAELDKDTGLAGCHGVYLNFYVKNSNIALDIQYASPSINGADAVQRAFELMTRYEALNYGVYRRKIMTDFTKASAQIKESMFWELFSSLAPLAVGKMKRIPDIYYARRSGMAQTNPKFAPSTWVATNPDEFLLALADYREKQLAYFGSKGVDVGPDTRKQIALAHLIYISKELQSGGITRQLQAGRTTLPLATNGSLQRPPGPLLLSLARFFISTGFKTWYLVARKLKPYFDVQFSAPNDDSIKFTASKEVRSSLSDEQIVDFSKYCRVLNSEP